MRHADHCAFNHALHRINLGFHLFRIDIEAARNDQILAASDNVDIALCIDLAEIARDEKPVGAEFGSGFFRHPPIALEHVRAFDLEHPDLVNTEMLACVGIGHPHRNPRQRKADRARHPVSLIGI